MKRILAILMACLFMVAVMAVMAAPAFAQITKEKPGKGNPATNPAGKCPGGHNKDEPGNAFNNKCR